MDGVDGAEVVGEDVYGVESVRLVDVDTRRGLYAYFGRLR